MSVWNETKKSGFTKATERAGKKEVDRVVLEKLVEPAVAAPAKIEKPKDERLDKLVPLVVEMATRLLAQSGMIRFRADFVSKIKEIMDEPK